MYRRQDYPVHYIIILLNLLLQLFSLNRGDEYLPSTLPSSSGTLFWSVTRKTSPSEVIIKVRTLPDMTTSRRTDGLRRERYRTQ